jgi:uncharacterized protein (TIGR02444 family)
MAGSATSTAAADEALWQFSLAFYTLTGVAAALIELQDRDGLDVNLMLFALWHGISGRGRLDNHQLTEAEQATRSIRTGVVEPLRALRRNLKHSPDQGVQQLREEVKRLELAGERLVQTRLARLAEEFAVSGSTEDRRSAAFANLSLFIGAEKAGTGEAALIRQALERYMQGG